MRNSEKPKRIIPSETEAPKKFFEMGDKIEERRQRKFEKKEDIPETVRNFFEIKNKIEERWRKKLEKKEEVPEAVRDFFKQLDKIDERWQKKLKGKEGVPGAVQDFFKQMDKIEDRWRKKMEKKEEVPEVIRDFFEMRDKMEPEWAKRFKEGPPKEERPPEEKRPSEEAVKVEKKYRMPVEVEKRYPWEEALERETGVFVKEHLKKAELSPNEKKAIAGNLKKERDAIRIEFAKKWFVENRDKVEEAKFKFEPFNVEHMIRVTGRLGGFNEMDQYRPETLTGEEAPTYKEKLENVKALETDLYKEVVPLDSQFLMVNSLDQRAKRIKGEVKRAEDWATKKALKKEDKELFEVRKGLAKNTSKIFSGEEMKGFWKGTWERKIKELDLNLEEAIGLTQDVYKTVKDRIATEFTLKELKKKPKTKGELEAIEKVYKEGGGDSFKFIDKLVNRRGEYGLLTGGWNDEEIGTLQRALMADGIRTTPERIKEGKETLDERGFPYEKMVKDQMGIVEWFLHFIFLPFTSPGKK